MKYIAADVSNSSPVRSLEIKKREIKTENLLCFQPKFSSYEAPHYFVKGWCVELAGGEFKKFD